MIELQTLQRVYMPCNYHSCQENLLPRVPDSPCSSAFHALACLTSSPGNHFLLLQLSHLNFITKSLPDNSLCVSFLPHSKMSFRPIHVAACFLILCIPHSILEKPPHSLNVGHLYLNDVTWNPESLCVLHAGPRAPSTGIW